MANIAKAAGGAIGALAIAKTYFGPKKDDLTTTGRDPAMLTGSVSEIRSEALNTIGIARSTRGSVFIPSPGRLSAFAAQDVARIMAFYATDFNIPGATIETASVRRYGFGTATKYPVTATIPDITITFIVDGQGLIQKYFYNWINNITNFTTRVNGTALGEWGANMFEVGYKKDSSGGDLNVVDGRLYINSENNSAIGNIDSAPAVIAYSVKGMYPVAMSDINMSWNASNGLATLTVKFACDSYSIDESANLQARQFDTTLPSLGGMQQVVRGATLVQTVAALKRPRNVNDIISVVNNTAMVASIVKKW